ncbi:hypothetical protein [Streptantibioticus silvisoli]|uniref:Phage head morphogenesis domain-containing protein n=1 Tax=Streptantibioticus silvisoli TaxID=2705255 RepID=A0ABT6W4P5_9ACTN|nr:hypothetical protein [Streptantibioticus silvisoli]MDI5965727.1 hypothetical protein [Streptantibioticus silvisoli]
MSAHSIALAAREAFAAGWAVSGGPMTGRVRIACVEAVRIAVEQADDPQILEATLDLGKLEGMWALLFQRREKLTDQYTAAVTTAWRKLIRPRLFRDGLHHLRAQLGLVEAAPDPAAIRAAALAAARGILVSLATTSGWAALRQTIRDALAAGRAEGIVNAVAIAAERVGRIGLDWDIAFDHAYQQLARLDELWSEADTWLARLLDRATTDLGRLLAEQAANGGSYEDMLDAASTLLDTADVNAVAFVVDWALTTGADQGALTLYTSEGVQAVDWITAGDGRVCPTCEDNETGSPWQINSVPQAPAHPLCRCVLAADMNLTRFAGWFTT